MSKQLIVLKQNSIIEFTGMQARGIEVRQQIAEMNIDTIEATEENRASMKKMRAELNKEVEVFEDQRKMIKEKVNTSYNEFNDAYTEEIKTPFTEAVVKLKNKIDEVESKMLETKKAELQAHFDFKAQAFDFITLDMVGLNIILSATDKSLKAKIDTFVDQVDNDMQAIEEMDHATRIKSLYMNSLDLSGSITQALADIKTEEKIEADRIENERIAEENRVKAEKEKQEREQKEADDRAALKKQQEEKAAKDLEEAEKLAEANKSKEAKTAVKRASKALDDATQEAEQAQSDAERRRLEKEESDRLEAEANKIHTMSFTVKGNLEQLKGIKSYMDSIGVIYE